MGFFLTRGLRKARAAWRIPAEAYDLIDIIHHRYSGLDFSNGEFRGLSKKQKLEWLIRCINQDHEITRLNTLSYIGSIIVFSQVRNTPSAGWGQNLCIGDKGLFIYDWNDYKGKHDKIPVSPDALKRLDIPLDCETLREAIVAYTSRENYVARVAEFKKFS